MEAMKVNGLKNIDDVIDELADGIYALPWPKGASRFRIKDLLKYCDEMGKDTEDLTEQELKKFQV